MEAASIAQSSPSAPDGGILGWRRWRLALQLGGIGDIIGTLLPLFIVSTLELPVPVATGAVAAYTGGALLGQVLLWGRLADRLRDPRGLIVAGTAFQGALIIVLASVPISGGVVVMAGVLGAVAVSMDGALLRLALSNLDERARLAAASRFSILVQRGALVGLATSTVALALLPRWIDEDSALRTVMLAIGATVLLEAVIVAGTLGRQRVATQLTRSLRELGEQGVVVVFSMAATPVQNVIRFARGASRVADTRERVPDTLRVMLVSLAIVHLGYAWQGTLTAIYLREAAGVPSSVVVAALLAGSAMTSIGLVRFTAWLETVPAVQVQVFAAAVRATAFGLFAVVALAPEFVPGIVAYVLLFGTSQLALGGVMASNARRLAELAPGSRRAEVAAWQSGAIGVGAVIGASVGGAVVQAAGYPAAFLGASITASIGALSLLRW